MHYFRRVRACLLIIMATLGICAAELSKGDAAKILAAMGDKSIIVITVINGVGGLGLASFSNSNVSTVIAYAERNGFPQKRIESFIFDKELGWFVFDIDTKGRRACVWTTTGLKELKPASDSSK